MNERFDSADIWYVRRGTETGISAIHRWEEGKDGQKMWGDNPCWGSAVCALEPKGTASGLSSLSRWGISPGPAFRPQDK